MNLLHVFEVEAWLDTCQLDQDKWTSGNKEGVEMDEHSY